MLPKELPEIDGITACPSSRHKPTPVNSTFLWISISMCNPSISQISAPLLTLTRRTGFLSFFCPNVSFVVV